MFIFECSLLVRPRFSEYMHQTKRQTNRKKDCTQKRCATTASIVSLDFLCFSSILYTVFAFGQRIFGRLFSKCAFAHLSIFMAHTQQETSSISNVLIETMRKKINMFFTPLFRFLLETVFVRMWCDVLQYWLGYKLDAPKMQWMRTKYIFFIFLVLSGCYIHKEWKECCHISVLSKKGLFDKSVISF